ncbi:MAG: ATP-binding protein [Myxococcota bacterium]
MIGIAITDGHGAIRHINEAFAKITGYGVVDIEDGQLCVTALMEPPSHAALREAMVQADPQLLDQVGPIEQLIAKGGERVPVVVELTMVTSGDTVADHRYTLSVVDLRPQRQREAELLEELARLRPYKSLVDSHPAPIFVKEYSDTRSGVYTIANPVCVAVMGFSTEQVIGHTDHDLFPDHVAKILRNHDREVLTKGEPVIVEEQTPDARTGGVIDVITVKIPLVDEQGRSQGIGGTTTDITTQKELTRQLSALIDALPDRMFRMDIAGVYRDCRNSREANSPVRCEQIIGSNIRDSVLPEEIQEQTLAAVRVAVAEDRLHEFEYEQGGESGRRRFEARFVKSGSDEAMVLVRDITDATQTRRDLEMANMALKLVNRELRKFAYVASHDLQEPLRTVLSYIDLLERHYGQAFDDRGNKWLRYIVTSARRMRQLLDDLLEYSQVGQLRELRLLDSNQIVRELVADLSDEVERLGGTVEIGTLPAVVANETELRQIFYNLISNALKFRRTDLVPLVHIWAEPERDGWTFTVKDNGIGIDPGHHKRIFEVFQRLHTHDEYEGTGIGLALVKKIVEGRGGQILVRSRTGQGSEFRFTLPVSPQSERIQG